MVLPDAAGQRSLRINLVTRGQFEAESLVAGDQVVVAGMTKNWLDGDTVIEAAPSCARSACKKEATPL